VVRTFDAPEALGTRFYEVRARSAINEVPKRSRMPFRYTINPYRGCAHACAYCFARPTHTYLDFNAREDFEREIVVKVNAPELVRRELARPSWKGDHVALGTNTDPYQWVEGRYRLMEGIWKAMRDFANPCSVLTKSPLLLRDIELMKELVEVTDFVANLSIPTIDEKAWRQTEPHTPHQRLAGAGARDRRAGRGGRRRDRRSHRAASPGRGQGDLVRLASTAPPRPGGEVRAAVRAGGLPATGGERPPLVPGPARGRSSRHPRCSQPLPARQGKGRPSTRQREGEPSTRARGCHPVAGAAIPALLSALATAKVPSAHTDASQKAAG
jgi:radical SAM family protein